MRSSVTFLTTVAVAVFRRARLLYATALIEDSPATDQEAPPLQGATRGCTPEV
ncbi:hypothetical protein OIE67_16400 [Nonomuraea fuscirosea]|uniref:hypothetical protein n=1 Tax=Nonomuraea fuscirosea TaxID=1291556 RepID=UPI002DD9652A|nr:hypothetical protein [Nonomuraea fuscirosea]WSA56120.1 hypothetical protein OIE67_16400 [Nonomuraea fuscirosea]